MLCKPLSLGVVLAAAGSALAGFNPNSQSNIAVYWGQNSANQASTQSRLSTYCSNTPFNIIPLGFLNVIKNPTTVNFANAGDNCTAFAGSTLLSCPQLEADIKTCQSAGKTILLSIGGATYTEGGFSSASEAQQWASTIWAMFGPQQSGSTVKRPFGSAVVDGFDFDFESPTQNMAPFANRLRSLMDADRSKKFYLSAAPQCVYPDAADRDMLIGADATYFDFLLIQYYNNGCGASSYIPGAATQWNFNFDVWNNWATQTSKNPNVKLLLGIPANTGAGAGYVSGSQLQAVISYVKQFSNFGGVMLWDMSQLYRNPGFINEVVADLGGTAPPPPPPSSTLSTTTRPTTTTTTSSRTTGPTPTPTGGPLVPQWGQCGGQGWTGPTVCQPPYTCVAGSTWWSDCR
ncbi:glycoside hydrolase family 18 protein [Microdochium trichocladiopsis]|uniref:chitinase n=1 Tax=Microdochium trichocladiopsis TaxID=1682393 RepID=A0A9P9BLE8_9PEZI|nr:glycoside hydrolase family 18 protein [Microdochium trichocladiopsis]KAH7024819.1 glycoside hydrolase family 18 protein [Microdochium trichocladiopsis]